MWDAIVLVAWFLDLRRLPAPGRAQRRARVDGARGPRRAAESCGSTSGTTSDVTIFARVTDFASSVLRPAPAELSLTVPARGEAPVDYDVLPGVRGDTTLDFVALRYRSAAGLAERWGGLSLPQTVRVYPDIGEAQRQALALIRARQIVMEKRRANVHGLGRDFHSLREFQQGDELRDVCWTATARRGRLVARTYQPERSQTVWIVVDAGRLMRARDGRHTGLDRAVNAAFALAQVASGAGDRVALLAYGRGRSSACSPAAAGRIFGSCSTRWRSRAPSPRKRITRGPPRRSCRRRSGARSSCGSPTSRRAPPCRK